MQISAEEDYLVVRVVDANYPLKMRVFDDDNYTRFGITLDYQIENPTQSSIKVTYVCGPFPFPRFKTNLLNKSLEVEQLFIVEWIAGEHFINPGIRNKSQAFAFEISGHENKSLPRGNYEFWLDYTNCSYVPVIVVTEKMYLDVNETSITYYFDYNNESRVFSVPEQTNYQTPLIIISSFLVAVLIRRRNQRKVKKLWF